MSVVVTIDDCTSWKMFWSDDDRTMVSVALFAAGEMQNYVILEVTRLDLRAWVEEWTDCEEVAIPIDDMPWWLLDRVAIELEDRF